MKEILSGLLIALVVLLAFWTGFMFRKMSNWEQLTDAYQKGRLSGLDDSVAIKCSPTRKGK